MIKEERKEKVGLSLEKKGRFPSLIVFPCQIIIIKKREVFHHVKSHRMYVEGHTYQLSCILKKETKQFILPREQKRCLKQGERFVNISIDNNQCFKVTISSMNK